MGNTRSFADTIEWHLDALIKAKKIDFQGGHSHGTIAKPGSRHRVLVSKIDGQPANCLLRVQKPKCINKLHRRLGHSPLLVTSPATDIPLVVLEHIVKQTFDIN